MTTFDPRKDPYRIDPPELETSIVWHLCHGRMADLIDSVDPDLFAVPTHILLVKGVKLYRTQHGVYPSDPVTVLGQLNHLCDDGKLTFEEHAQARECVEKMQVASKAHTLTCAPDCDNFFRQRVSERALVAAALGAVSIVRTKDASAPLKALNAAAALQKGPGGLKSLVLSEDMAKSAPVDWMWRHRMARGVLHTLTGRGGVGKSTALADIIARFCMGAVMPGEDVAHQPPGKAIIIGAEDDSRMIALRLRLAGYDLSSGRVLVLPDDTDPETPARRLVLPTDAPMLERQIADFGAGLVVIEDVGIKGKENDADDVRTALASLVGVARRTGAAIVFIRHVKKGADLASNAGRGSGAWRDVVRIGLVMEADPDDSDARVLVVEKSNLGRKPPALSIRQDEDPLGEVSSIRWCERAEDITADDLLSAAYRRHNQRVKGDESRTDRRDVFAAAVKGALSGGTLSKDDLRARLRHLGFTDTYWKNHLPKVAETFKGADGRWYWRVNDMPGESAA